MKIGRSCLSAQSPRHGSGTLGRVPQVLSKRQVHSQSSWRTPASSNAPSQASKGWKYSPSPLNRSDRQVHNPPSPGLAKMTSPKPDRLQKRPSPQACAETTSPKTRKVHQVHSPPSRQNAQVRRGAEMTSPPAAPAAETGTCAIPRDLTSPKTRQVGKNAQVPGRRTLTSPAQAFDNLREAASHSAHQIELPWVPSEDRSNKTALPDTGPRCIQVVYK